MTPPSPTSPRVAFLSLSLVLLSLFLQTSAVPSASGGLISDALAELPDGLGSEIQALMASMNMTEQDTHFSRLVKADKEKVNQSVALVRFPTPENGFAMSYVQMTHDLNPESQYVALVCGHTKPSKCLNERKHETAPSTHPCGVDDAADRTTGPFCEVLALSHPATTHGELLVHASEVLDSVKLAYERDPSSYETPTIHLEIVDAETFEALMNVGDDGGFADVDALEEALRVSSPSPESEPEGDASGKVKNEVGRKLLRSLLRLGGGIGGARGAGMRRGVGGVGRFGGAGGIGRGAGFRRGRNVAANQVMAANFYGNRGRAVGAGQAAYFNDPGIPGGK
jgi:hypothetical protein